MICVLSAGRECVKPGDYPADTCSILGVSGSGWSKTKSAQHVASLSVLSSERGTGEGGRRGRSRRGRGRGCVEGYGGTRKVTEAQELAAPLQQSLHCKPSQLFQPNFITAKFSGDTVSSPQLLNKNN